MHDERRTPPPSSPPGSSSSSSSRDEPPSAPTSRVQPAGRRLLLTPFQQGIEKLGELYPSELADVIRYADKLKGARGAAVNPDLISRLLSELLRLEPSYRHLAGVPVARLRTELSDVVRPELDEALLEAERRNLLRLVPVQLPAAFAEPGSGVPSSRGLLYFVAAAGR